MEVNSENCYAHGVRLNEEPDFAKPVLHGSNDIFTVSMFSDAIEKPDTYMYPVIINLFE